jgi:hypothetical protein
VQDAHTERPRKTCLQNVHAQLIRQQSHIAYENSPGIETGSLHSEAQSWSLDRDHLMCFRLVPAGEDKQRLDTRRWNQH